MESDRDLRAFLTDADRAAAPYIDYLPTPRWYPPAVGAWAAAMMFALSALPDHPAVADPILLVLVAGEGAFFAWYRRYRQTMPRLHGAPPEINGAFRRYAVVSSSSSLCASLRSCSPVRSSPQVSRSSP